MHRIKDIYQYFNSGGDIYDHFEKPAKESMQFINGGHRQKIHFTEIQDIHIQPIKKHDLKVNFTEVTEKDVQPRPKVERKYP